MDGSNITFAKWCLCDGGDWRGKGRRDYEARKEQGGAKYDEGNHYRRSYSTGKRSIRRETLNLSEEHIRSRRTRKEELLDF